MLITPMILRHNAISERQTNLPAQITEEVNSTATTTITTGQTETTTTTIKTLSESRANETITVFNPAKITTSKTTTQTTQKSVVDNLTTTEHKTTTGEATTTVANSTTVAKNTTTGGTTGVNNAPVHGYYPTKEEWDMFCVVVCSETGYCEDKAQLAVAHTVINRLSNPIYPNTIKEILTQRAQYTCVQNYYTGNMRPGLEIGGAAYNHTMQLIHQAWEEWDFTHGAVAYYNPHMIGWNAWFEQYECVYEDKYGRFFHV